MSEAVLILAVGTAVLAILFGARLAARATGIIALLWLRYSWRILQITRAWPTMRERDAPEQDE